MWRTKDQGRYRPRIALEPTIGVEVTMAEQERWQLAGNAPEVYARELVPSIFGPWAPILVDLAEPATGERIIDVACGTGVVARAAAQRLGPSGRVTGVDINPGMLAAARESTQPQPAQAPIDWREETTPSRGWTALATSSTASWACNIFRIARGR
jgi:SAM-dependent methyltransferase